MTFEIKYINIDTALAIHEAMIQRFGGSMGLRDVRLLESALAQPAQSFLGKDFYPTISEKAARLAFEIARNHSFIDGNKRAAAACMAAFLSINSVGFSPGKGEVADKIIALAAGEIDYWRWPARNPCGGLQAI